MKYKYIKKISYAIGNRDNKVTKEKIFEMQKQFQERQQKEVFAITR